MTSVKSENPHERYINETEDSDTASTFDWRPSGFSPRYGYYLTFQLEDQSGNASGSLAQLSIGDSSGLVTTTDYQHLEWDGTGWVTNTRSQWNLGFTNTSQPLFGRVFIGGGNYVSEPTNPYPVLHAVIGTHTGQSQILKGKLTSSLSAVTDVRLFASANSTGWAVLEGWGPITDR